MILQALVRHYEDLAAQNKIARVGWSPVKVSVALCLDEQGGLRQAVSVKTEQTSGKKTLLAPQVMMLPVPVKRTAGIAANFLCDKSGYVLGMDEDGCSERAQKCFACCRELHETVLAQVDTPAARAIKGFFSTWQPEQAAEHPALQDVMDDLLKGGNLVFRVESAYAQENPEIRSAWQRYYDGKAGAPQMTCLVTGQQEAVESIHPAIKGLWGAQSSGAALVSFNAPALCSYGKTQNLNAPTGKYAAFAYTTALNALLADREHAVRLGDTTVVCWAEGGEPAYQSAFGAFAWDQKTPYSTAELQGMVTQLLQGQSVLFETQLLDPQRPFYILGLAPNAARISVRFFLRNSFGTFLENVQAHYARLKISGGRTDSQQALPIWRLLNETVNQNARDKSPVPGMAGEVLQAILNNTPYPATLLNGVALRIRADHDITYGRAAILKAYYTKNNNPYVPKEVLTVSLNPDSTNIPYTLGRLFSLLEGIQNAANPGIKATIKDKYFNAASATPSHVFPVLINLAQKHLAKLDDGWRINYEKQLQLLIGVLPESYPDHLNLPQQGTFQLGYYHQTQKRYEKKEEK